MTRAPQGKRIVLCFDGTANQIGAGNLTNVAKLFLPNLTAEQLERSAEPTDWTGPAL